MNHVCLYLGHDWSINVIGGWSTYGYSCQYSYTQCSVCGDIDKSTLKELETNL